MRCVVFGSSGGIGKALVETLRARDDVAVVYAGSRGGSGGRAKLAPFPFDLREEASIAAAADLAGGDGPLDLVIVATGLLQNKPLVTPEKSWSALDAEAMAMAFSVNAIGPALIAKHFMPLLNKEAPSRFAFLSARVGSLGDNRLGGWHSYRASKAALNMLVRNFAIELRRINPSAIAVALHPGTVDTPLSEPFQANVPADRLFDPARAAQQLIDVLLGLSPVQSGGFFAWDGSAIEW
ncbi:SDR family NAD(P)-dependent oxidoreductase [Croceicoccus bisphenolivorans]|uniref:SDR family NAD(P)-dependent oxidoreductase n=1 Tax=Croceicoccus bisphenolivorans TaxID=1783232 RepID=UPI0008349BE6|nr:SDR family NAD(P)-dependent oxidoreductase [Croceicoccus bisphenolivorans]